jgi:hypothetical protein
VGGREEVVVGIYESEFIYIFYSNTILMMMMIIIGRRNS